MIDGRPSAWHGEVIPPTMYYSFYTAWSLSPGVAFSLWRNFQSKPLSRMPKNATPYSPNGNWILAYLGAKGKFAADPIIAGYWIHHGGNESYKQHATQSEQEQICYDCLDDVLDECDWKDVFFDWCTCMPVLNVVQWSQHVEKIKSRQKEDILKIMQRSMIGRIEVVKPAPSSVLEPVPSTVESDVVYV